MRSGVGKMAVGEGLETYEGEWRHDKREGTGTCYYRDGSECTGAWREVLTLTATLALNPDPSP